MDDDTSPFDKELTQALKQSSLSWNLSASIQKIKAWVDLGLPIQNQAILDRIGQKVRAANHIRIGLAFLATKKEVEQSDIVIRPTFRNEDVFALYHQLKSMISFSKEEKQKRWSHLIKFSDLNAQNKEGNTLLHLSVQKNDRNLAKKLIEKGYRLDLKNNAGKTQLDLMLESSTWKDILTLPGALSELNGQLESVLELPWAFNKPEFEKIMQYIFFGADPNTVGIWSRGETNTYGNTPLSVALNSDDHSTPHFL